LHLGVGAAASCWSLLGSQDAPDELLHGVGTEEDAQQDEVQERELLHQGEHVPAGHQGDGGADEPCSQPDEQDHFADSVWHRVVVVAASLPHGAVHQQAGPVQIVDRGEVFHRQHSVEGHDVGRQREQRVVQAADVEGGFDGPKGAGVDPGFHGNLLCCLGTL